MPPGKLPQGEAGAANRAFSNRMMNSGSINLPSFPQAICFTIEELRLFLDSAEKTINPDPNNPVPAYQQGIAIVPAFRKDKITVSLVATRFTADPLTGKVTSINNPVTGIHFPDGDGTVKKTAKKAKLLGGDPGEEQPPVGDNAYDNGSMYP